PPACTTYSPRSRTQNPRRAKRTGREGARRRLPPRNALALGHAARVGSSVRLSPPSGRKLLSNPPSLRVVLERVDRSRSGSSLFRSIAVSGSFAPSRVPGAHDAPLRRRATERHDRTLAHGSG